MGPIPKGIHCRVYVSPRFAIREHDSALRTCEGGRPPLKRSVSQIGRCPCSVKRMGAVSIVNGNVCGRFRDVLAWKVLSFAGTLTTFR